MNVGNLCMGLTGECHSDQCMISYLGSYISLTKNLDFDVIFYPSHYSFSIHLNIFTVSYRCQSETTRNLFAL